MREKSRFTSHGKVKSLCRGDKAVTESEVRVSIGVKGVERVLKLSGLDFRASLVLSNSEAARIGKLLTKQMDLKNGETGEQVVFFPRKRKPSKETVA